MINKEVSAIVLQKLTFAPMAMLGVPYLVMKVIGEESDLTWAASKSSARNFLLGSPINLGFFFLLRRFNMIEIGASSLPTAFP